MKPTAEEKADVRRRRKWKKKWDGGPDLLNRLEIALTRAYKSSTEDTGYYDRKSLERRIVGWVMSRLGRSFWSRLWWLLTGKYDVWNWDDR